ncbi:hypothetical protein BSKO_08416 [Bryopsis sp. KO-2023]|nr:hypothetical protein BSKO_08416 [Bryopsis sp. KO-2023]
MGRSRKPFVDKKKAVTYRLVFKSSEYGEESQERVFVPVRGPAGDEYSDVGSSYEGPGPMSAAMAHQLFFGGSECEATEEQREEMISLGLPDDGYNYLQHVRTVGKGKASLEKIEEEPQVQVETESVGTSGAGGVVASNFEPPTEDRKLVNARALTAVEEVDEDAADSRIGTTSAFSREVEGVRGQFAREIEDLETFMHDFNTSTIEEIDEGGVGDLLDDFIVQATQAGEGETTLMGDARVRDGPRRLAMPTDLSEDEDEDDQDIIEFDYMSRYADTLGSKGLGNRSMFSEKWVGTSASDLEGRRERNDQLTLLDEKFENMLLDYDDDELGGLEECADTIQGGQELREYAPEIEIFVDDIKAHGLKALVPEPKSVCIFDKDDDVLRITRDLDNAAFKGRRRIGRDEWEDVLVCVRTNAERLDCETVLSYRSKTSSYQPSRIDVVRSEKKKAPPPSKIDTSGQIKLSAKSGFPLEALEAINNRHEEGEEEEEDRSSGATIDTESVICTERKKGESPQERKARKAAVKEAQRQARVDKKQLKMMYRQEHTNQQKRMAGIITKNASTVVL